MKTFLRRIEIQSLNKSDQAYFLIFRTFNFCFERSVFVTSSHFMVTVKVSQLILGVIFLDQGAGAEAALRPSPKLDQHGGMSHVV